MIVRIGLSAFVILGLTGASAFAYIPPSQFLVKTMSMKHAGLKMVRVRSEVTAMDGDKPISVRFTELTTFDPKEGTLHCRAVDDAGHDLYVIDQRIGSLPVAAAVLFDSRPLELALSLKEAGIPVRTEAELLALKDETERRAAETEFLARWNSGYAWVIGKRQTGSPDPKDAQLWVEKDSFAPIRVIKGGQEVRMDRYRLYREFPYPRVITLLTDGKSVLQDEVAELAINSELASGKGAEHPADPSTSPPVRGFTDAGNSAPSALRDLIQKYFEQVR